MRAGLLRHVITIEQVTETQDDSGSVVETWATFKKVHSTYEPQSGTESFKEDQQQAFETVKFRIRYLAGITPKMRVSFDGRLFDILSAIDLHGMKKETHLMCREAV